MTGVKIITMMNNIGTITTIAAKARTETEPKAGSIVTTEYATLPLCAGILEIAAPLLKLNYFG